MKPSDGAHERRNTNTVLSMDRHGSALGYPDPTGAGPCLFVKGLHSDPVLLKRPVAALGNTCNYIFEIYGIHLAAKFINDQGILSSNLHFFVDCQPVISNIPEVNLALILESSKLIREIEDKNINVFFSLDTGT